MMKTTQNTDKSIDRMLKYIMSHKKTKQKKLPPELSKTLIANSREALSGFPKHLVPAEVTCKECAEQSLLCFPQVIISRSRVSILTSSGIAEFHQAQRKCDT